MKDLGGFKRLLLKRYIYDCKIQPDALPIDPDITLFGDALKDLDDSWPLYKNYRQDVRNGSLGKQHSFGYYTLI